jgi:hypothetical protein
MHAWMHGGFLQNCQRFCPFTKIVDVAPLAGLTALTELDLHGTYDTVTTP